MNKYVIYNILYLYIMELKSDSSVIIINSIGKYSNNHPRVEFKRGDVQIGTITVNKDNIQIGDSSLYTNLTNGPFIKILDTTQTFYLADKENNKIRKINISDAEVTTVDLSGIIIKPEAITQLGEDIFIFNRTNRNILKLDFSSNTVTPITKNDIVGDSYIYMTTDYPIQNGIKYSDTKNTFIYVSDRENDRILKVDPNGNSTTIPTVFYNPGSSFDPIALVCINNHLYVTEFGQNTIKKIEIGATTGTLDNSWGSSGTLTIGTTVNYNMGGATISYSNNVNKGGLTNIGTDIYFGTESLSTISGGADNGKTNTIGLIFKIPTTGSNSGTESALLQHTHSAGPAGPGGLPPPPSLPQEFTFPHRLSHDGTNFYLWNYLTPMHKILKASINGSGQVHFVTDYIGQSISGYLDTLGTSAKFDTPYDMIPFFDCNSVGIDNTAIGEKALFSNTTGIGNVALGDKAGDVITTGDSNVIIGSEADISTGTGKNQIVIGAGAKGMGDSTVVLGDSLTIQETFLHGDVNINRTYVLPKTAGVTGQVLKYPATGKTLEWSIGGGGESEGNIQIGDSSLYTGISMKQQGEGFQDTFYVADHYNNIIRKVTADSVVTTLSLTLSSNYRPASFVYLNNILYILENWDAKRIDKLDLSINTLTPITAVNQVNGAQDMTTDGTYLYVANFSDNNILQFPLNGDNSTTKTIWKDGFTSNPTAIICIGSNIYVTEWGGSIIKKIPINSDGTAGTITDYVDIAGTQNYGGLINIGTDIYFGATNNNKIYKIPTTGTSAGTAIALLSEGGGDLVLSFEPYRLSHDGTNLYANGAPINGIGSNTRIFKIPINSNGAAGTVVSFVGSDSLGSADGTGSAAGFYGTADMIPVIEPFAGKNNIAIGEKALYSNTIGNSNVAVGDSTLLSNTTGDCNVAVGTGTGNLITIGDSNVIIGYGANVSSSNASNQIVIGAGAKGMGDSTVVLGNSGIAKVYMAQDGKANIYSGGLIINNTEDDLTSGSAIDLTKFATGFKTDAADEIATLAAGTEGQIITLYMHTHNGGNMVVTVANAGWASNKITFSAMGQTCKLQYLDSKWFVISANGVTFP